MPQLTHSAPTQAVELVRTGRAAAMLERIDAASRAGDPTCVLYQPSSPDGAKGRCGMYEFRPGLCRLFGFSGRRSEAGARAG